MKKWLFLLAGIVVVSLTFWWFWSLGSLPLEVAPRITLQVDRGPVSVRHASDTGGSWVDGKAGDALVVGDRIRTGEGASAAVDFFGAGESRLAENSELRIDAASAASDEHPFTLDLHLVAGRMWSHVLRLLDLDSAVAVRVNNVVATVRGTSFDVDARATGSVVSVADGAVQVNGDAVVSAGFMASLNGQRAFVVPFATSDEEKQSDWFVANLTRDAAFRQAARATLEQRLSQQGGTRPDSSFDGLAKASERLHLWLAPQSADALFARYAIRRLSIITKLINEGKSGLGFQAYAALDEDLKAHATLALRRRLGVLRLLFEDTGPADAAYRLKQKLEDLDVALAGSDQAQAAYARLVAVDARVDEAAQLIAQSSLDDAKNALDAAREGIGNVERDIDHLPKGVSAEETRTLRAKLTAMKAREASVRAQLEAALTPSAALTPESPTSTSATSTVTTVPVPSVASSTATTTNSIVKILLRATPNPAIVGQQVKLVVLATHADGTTEDVTAKSQFGLFGALGSLNGPVYDATAAGNVTIGATYRAGGQTFTASLSLQIIAQLQASAPSSTALLR